MNKDFKYLPKDKRKKILLICDDIRVHSGVATVAKEIVLHTAHHYNWVQLAAAVDHPESGKRFPPAAVSKKGPSTPAPPPDPCHTGSSEARAGDFFNLNFCSPFEMAAPPRVRSFLILSGRFMKFPARTRSVRSR